MNASCQALPPTRSPISKYTATKAKQLFQWQSTHTSKKIRKLHLPVPAGHEEEGGGPPYPLPSQEPLGEQTCITIFFVSNNGMQENLNQLINCRKEK